VHGLTVDAYAAQHPGVPGRSSSRSVAVHLMRLYLILEQGVDSVAAAREVSRRLARRHDFPWLPPPPSLGELTVLDVVGAHNVADHTARVERWARSVWTAWSPHHDQVRAWLEQ
jgi:hypothetical protein